MTQALCLGCGGIKFGAINPCPICGGDATGNMSMDILFSDHHLDVHTLEQFGAVIKVINQSPANEQLRRLSFLLYVSDHHPNVMRVSPTAAWVPFTREILNSLTLPTVELLPGRQGLPDLDAQASRKPWWQFWKRGP